MLVRMRAPEVGCLLIASPELGDPAFMRSVIYLLEHNRSGTLGLIINRPLDVGLGELWDGCPPNLTETRIAGEGGPVERQKGLLLHGRPGLSDSFTIAPGVAIGGNPSALVDAWPDGADTLGPRLFLGHAGWAPDQLSDEIAGGSWIVRAGHPSLLLRADPPEDLWQDLTAAGQEPPEPSLN